VPPKPGSWTRPPRQQQPAAQPPARQQRPPRQRQAAGNGLATAGPLRQVIQVAGGRLDGQVGGDSNALVLLNRVAFTDAGCGELDGERGKKALLDWARTHRLGQQQPLVAAVSARRAAALRTLAEQRAGTTDSPARSGKSISYLRLRAEPEWRLAVGLGNKANPHEIGLALHGTYGWPVIPGSALKGLAAAWAESPGSGADPADVRRVLGGPRPGERITVSSPAGMGTVRFLDAVPDGEPVPVALDVLTPHVTPYYDALASEDTPVPPAEYHNPVPVTFLTVRGGFAVDLWGTSDKDLGLAAQWLTAAGEELGAGAKTAAGYGYLTLRGKQ
jgi:CRISPR-associated protein Cmr6